VTTDRTQEALTGALRALLDGRSGTVCPSEAARAVGGEDEASWRPLMPAAREAAARLADAGEVEVTQRGEVVDVRTARGPVRVRRRPAPPDQPTRPS
jgi:hypothetical protein